MRAVLSLLAVAGLAACAASASVHFYGWEDGVGTDLGQFGSGTPPIIATNVMAPDPVHSGLHSLKLVDNEPSGTPQSYVAWITGLQDGDSVVGSIWRYDDTPSVSPSGRIWGHWNDDPGDINGYNGSASGNSDYGLGLGWDETSYTWTVPAGSGHTGLVIELRTYSNPGDTVWFDDLTVDIPDHASVMLVPEPASLALLALGALTLVRRR